jgi:hypothetical protein
VRLCVLNGVPCDSSALESGEIVSAVAFSFVSAERFSVPRKRTHFGWRSLRSGYVPWRQDVVRAVRVRVGAPPILLGAGVPLARLRITVQGVRV